MHQGASKPVVDKAEVNVVEQGRSPTAWHFAYGANMCSTVLSKRRGIQPLSAHAACVEGYDVVFNMPGLYPIEPAFANLVVQEGGVAYGVLYELSAHDFERLRSFEGKYYADVRLRVRTQAGWAIHAHAFQGRSKAPPRRPSQRYLALLIEGAKEHHLPPDYVKRLQQTPSIHIPVISALMYAAARPRGTLALAKEKAGLISY